MNTTNHYNTHQVFSDCCVFTSRCLVVMSNNATQSLITESNLWLLTVNFWLVTQDCVLTVDPAGVLII
jgi:HKD family nuclease